MAHVSKWKIRELENVSSMLKSAAVIGVVSVEGVPSPQFQKMRRGLRGKLDIKMVKNSILARALDGMKGSKPGIDRLAGSVSGQVAVVTTTANPFKLFQLIEGTKTPAPAKGGEVSPIEIVVEPGDTGFKPGPIVGEMQKAGIPAAIDQGKVVIKQRKVLVKVGDRIPANMAPMLTQLNIFPLIVGLNLKMAHEGDMAYDRKVLNVDMDEFKGNVTKAAASAVNLAVNASYFNKLTAPIIVGKAHREALNLAVNAGVVNKETMPYLLAKAQSQMLAVASKAPTALDDELKARLG